MANLGVTSFDELNRLVGYERSMDYNTYFGEMQLTDAQKQDRIALAEMLEPEILQTFEELFFAYPYVRSDMVDDLKDRYLDVLVATGLIATLGAVTSPQEARYYSHAEKFAADTIATTRSDPERLYNYSEDRAMFCAENEANMIYGDEEFWQAIEDGATEKTWHTVGDNHVRESHAEVNGQTLPIAEPFMVGGSLMMHAHDDSMGSGAEELVGCRCSTEYSGYVAPKREYNDLVLEALDAISKESEVAYEEGVTAQEQGAGVVEKSNTITVDGTTYTVHGKAVVFEHGAIEEDGARELSRIKGEPVVLLPKVNQPDGVKSVDCILKYSRIPYELKSIEGDAEKTIKRRAKTAKGRSTHVLIDVLEKSGFSLDEATEKVKALFNEKDTAFIEEIVFLYHSKYVDTYTKE